MFLLGSGSGKTAEVRKFSHRLQRLHNCWEVLSNISLLEEFKMNNRNAIVLYDLLSQSHLKPFAWWKDGFWLSLIHRDSVILEYSLKTDTEQWPYRAKHQIDSHVISWQWHSHWASTCMYICVFTYICMFVLCVSVCLHAFLCLRAYVFACAYKCAYVV